MCRERSVLGPRYCRAGALLSTYGMTRLGSSLSVLDFVHLGSTLSAGRLHSSCGPRAVFPTDGWFASAIFCESLTIERTRTVTHTYFIPRNLPRLRLDIRT